MTSLHAQPRSRPASVAQILAVPIVAAVIALGVWVAGGLLTDDFRGSVALTDGLVRGRGRCLPAGRRAARGRWRVARDRHLSPSRAGAIGAFLASTTVRDRVVAEQVVTAGRRPRVARRPAPGRRPRRPSRPRRGPERTPSRRGSLHFRRARDLAGNAAGRPARRWPQVLDGSTVVLDVAGTPIFVSALASSADARRAALSGAV